MGETLRAEEVIEMEKQMSNELQKSKLKNGEAPLLDPTTHRKLMRLFSRNTNVNLCLPVVKLHRLDTKDLKECELLNKDCADYLCKELTRLKRNARKRAKRKFIRAAKEGKVFIKQECEKVPVPVFENLTNGIKDSSVAGPSRKSDVTVPRHSQDEGIESPLKRPKSEGKIKKKLKKEKLPQGENSDPSPQGSSVLKEPHKLGSWEEKYLPSLLGPRAPLPPAPLLNLPKLEPPSPMGIPRPFLPFDGSLASGPPPLKPIHSAVRPNPPLGIIPGLPGPPPLLVGSKASVPLGGYHPPTQHTVSLPNNYAAQIRNTPSDILPPAPDLKMKSEKRAKPPPMITYPPLASKIPHSGIMDGWKPVAPSLGKTTQASSQKTSESLSNASYHLGSTSTQSCQLPVNQSVCTNSYSTTTGVSSSDLSASQAPSTSDVSSNVVKNLKSDGVINQTSVNLKDTWNSSTLKDRFMESIAHGPAVLPLMPQQEHMVQYTTVSKRPPVTSHISSSVSSIPFKDNSPLVTDSSPRDSLIPSSKTASSSSRIMVPEHSSVESRSKSSVVPTFPGTPLIVTSHSSVVKSVPSNSSTNNVEIPTSVSQVSIPFVPATSHQDFSVYSPQEVTKPENYGCQSLPTTKSQLYYLLLPSSMPTIVSTVPVPDCSRDNVVEKAQASNEPSLGDNVKKSPSFKKRSVGAVSSSILPHLDSGISRGDKQQFLKSSEPVETSDNAEKCDERSIPPASLHTLTSVIMTASSSSPLVTESEMPSVVNESQVSTPTKRNYKLLGFVTDEELEAFIAGWLKENYELCLGADVEQYKVQGHFNMYLRAKGRKHNQPPPILNCLKKVFGEAVTTRRHRAVEGQQRWHYCHIRLRENVKMPYVKPPKSRVRKRSRGNSTSAINEVPDRKVTEENEEFSQGLSGYDDSTVRVTSSLAVLAHLINTTKLPDGRLVLNNMFEESGSSVKVEVPVCNSESTNQQVETSTICDQVEKPSSSVELEKPSSSTHVEMASSSTHAESPSSSSQDESPSSSAQVENPSDSAATEASSASAHAEAEAGCETLLSMVHEEASNSPQAEASSSLAQAEASSSSAKVEASSSSGETLPIPDNSEAPLAELPASSAGPLVAFSDSDNIIGQSEASNSESNTTSNHLTEWIQAKIASGKKVHVATLVVCLKKLRHCQVTNLFMKRHRINMRSGLRVRQSLRTWDIRSFLRSGGKKVFPIPTLRSKRLPKIGPVGSKSAAVQEMLLGARIGVDEAFIEDSLPSSSSSIVRPRSKPYPVKKQVSCEKVPPALESEKITPVINRKDKYLLMKNERLTVGQKRFAYWIGLDLAKRARKNRRLDRVEGSNRRLDLSFFGLKENPDPSSWTMIENVKGGKKGTTVIFQPPNETTIVSTSSSEIAARPMALPQGYPPSIPPPPPAPAALPPVPQACASSVTSKVITISSQGKVFATVPFPPVQTTIAPTTTVPTSLIPKVSSHEFNKPPTSSIPSGSEDNTAAGPSNRASPPPRLQFMGGNVPGFASTLREMAAHVRAQRSPMPPPLSFMGPSAMESQGRQSLHPGMSQANARQWPGNVDYSYHQAPPMRKYGVINHTRQVMPKQPLTIPINHTRQVMPKQPPTMPVHVMSHQTHQYASAPHPAHGAPVLDRQLNQVHNVRSHVTDQRPSSLPHSAQGHVLLEQRPSSEPRSAEVNMSERVPSSSGQPHSTEGQLYKNTMHYSHGQYSGMSVRPGYNYTQHPGTDPKSGMRTTQAHGVAGQQLYNQPHHVQGHSYTHQQQSNIPHNVSGHNNLPGHMLTNQQVSSQTYARGYIYPNQQMHGLQSHTVINQQLRNHPQENQLYLMPRQQSVNQIPNMQGYNSSQMHYNTQGQVSNQQLSSSSYSIQNLMLPVQQHYRGPSIPQECPPTMQVPGGSHLQSVSNDNTTCSTQNIQRQAVDSQEAWNRPVQYVHPVSNDHHLERTQVDQLDTPGYSSTAEASSNNHSSSVLHKPENSGATQYNVLQNTGEPSSYREARSVIMQASSQNDSSHSTGKVKFSSTNTFDERLGRVSQSQEDGCHIQREKLSSVEPNSRLEEELSQQHQREREDVHVSETQTHNVKNVQNDWASSETQRESHDRGRGVLSQALMGTERNRDSVMVSESHSNESFAEDLHSTNVSKTFKTNASEKDSTFTTEQEQLPCDLDQINVSRFGLEENLNISSILQDTDKCSYQKDGLFDKLENNQAEVSKDRQNNPIPTSQQSDGKDILQESNTQTTSEESAMDESDFGTLRGNLREHLAKIEPLLCRLLEIGLPSSSDNVKDTAVQLMEVEGYRNKWNWEDDLQKWYEEFSVSYGHLFHSKAKKQQLSSPAKNEVALWINKVKGEMLPFCSAHDGRIFYMQELNFFLDRQTRQIKYHKMFASSKICSNEKDTVSVLFTFNAEGQIGPGIIIFPRMVIPEKLFASLKNTSGGNEWVIGSSANGWLYSDCISEFVSDVFMPWLESHEVQKPVALFTSEYVSSVPLTEMCQNFVPHGLHLLLVPRAMSSVISPAEKIVVHYFISNWGKIVREWCTANLSQSLMEENFAPFIISTIRNRIFNGNVRKTFLELGMWPFEGRIVFEQFQDSSL